MIDEHRLESLASEIRMLASEKWLSDIPIIDRLKVLIREENEACALIADAKAEECREAGLTTLYSCCGDARCEEVAESIRARVK